MKPSNKPAPPDVRFWRYVQKTDSCWLWTGAEKNKGCGYGTITIEKRTVLAHRFSFILHAGPIPEGMLVCHSCDNPRCVNPAHLFLGSPLDNMRDKCGKGRHYTRVTPNYKKGAAHPKAKLTEDQVREIRRLYATGTVIQIELASQFNISKGVIQAICSGKIWKDLL